MRQSMSGLVLRAGQQLPTLALSLSMGCAALSLTLHPLQRSPPSALVVLWCAAQLTRHRSTHAYRCCVDERDGQHGSKREGPDVDDCVGEKMSETRRDFRHFSQYQGPSTRGRFAAVLQRRQTRMAYRLAVRWMSVYTDICLIVLCLMTSTTERSWDGFRHVVDRQQFAPRTTLIAPKRDSVRSYHLGVA
jgi:hypothetical protein